MLSADKKKKIGLFVFSVLFIVVGLLAGCGPQGQEGTWEETEAAQELIIGVGRNFYYGPESCQFVHGSTGVWESLTYLSENLEPLPLLAEDLIPDVEKKVWTVHLRRGIKFHDGTPLDADAVVANVMRLKEHPKFDEYGTFVNLEKVEAISDYEVRFTFDKPEPAFPAKVAYHGCPIFSPESFDSEGRIVHPYGRAF